MSGKFYNNPKTSMWANEWGNRASAFIDDEETVYDSKSQISDSTDDQNFSERNDVKERMRRLFESQLFTDVTFYPKKNRNVSISAHKAVLAIGSPLFTKMLFSNHSIDTAGVKMEVEISNLPFDAFTNIVKYLYTDEVFFESDSLVQGILDGAKQFGIQSLVDRCKQYFESIELTDQNVCSKLQFSISNKVDVLKERCIEFIQRNTYKVINSTDFQNCSPSTIRAICRLQSLNLRSEMQVLEAVMKWLYAQPAPNRKQLLEPLLKCIRFLTFTVNEMGDALKKYDNILTSDEGLSIMLYLYNPSKNPDYKSLPSWCNKNTMSRCFFNKNPCDINAGPNSDGPSKSITGKIFFPLKSDSGQYHVTELTSLLQIKCISGHHAIKAITLIFEKPMHGSFIGTLTINIHCHSNGFKTFEKVQIANSESVRVEFKRRLILVRRGELIDIEAEAKNIKSYKFLQFDDNRQVPMNPHFQCCVSSRPKQGKLFFISEIEYGPQDRNRGDGRNFSGGQRRRR